MSKTDCNIVYVPQLLYAFICRCTPTLLPCSSYHKQWCNEHWGTMNTGVHEHLFQLWFPQRICPVVGLLGHVIVLLLDFVRNLHTALCSDCINLYSHQQHKRVPFTPHCLQRLLFIDFCCCWLPFWPVWGVGGGRFQEGGNICIPMAESNTIL